MIVEMPFYKPLDDPLLQGWNQEYLCIPGKFEGYVIERDP